MSDKTNNNGGPAYPSAWHPDMGWSPWAQPEGMSLSDRFAGDALIGIISSGRHTPMGEAPLENIIDEVAQAAYKVADAMIQARGK